MLERVTFLCPSNISWQRKVTKKKGIPGARASHTRSPDEAQRNPGMLPTTNNPDFTSLHPGYGMRSTSARDALFGLRFVCEQKQIHREWICAANADPKGRSHGCDLQRNSLQQERNLKLVFTINWSSKLKLLPWARKTSVPSVINQDQRLKRFLQ